MTTDSGAPDELGDAVNAALNEGIDSIQIEALRDAAIYGLSALEHACYQAGQSFPDLLREIVTELARLSGSTEQLVRTRPGCWEADHIRALSMYEFAGGGEA